MLSELELPNVSELPPQRAFLRALVPNLAALKQIAAIMLTGSLARGDADRWSSVDLNLLWQESAPGSPMVESPHSALRILWTRRWEPATGISRSAMGQISAAASLASAWARQAPTNLQTNVGQQA